MENQSQNQNPSNIFIVDSNTEGQRIDNFLLKTLKGLNKSNIYKLLRKGQIRINGKRSKPTQRLMHKDKVRVPPFLVQAKDDEVYISDNILNQIKDLVVFKNKNYVVINKPSGMSVHSGTGVRFGLIDVCTRLFPNTSLQLAHRLDKDTSGCVVLAKSRTALNQFNQQQPIKKYMALVKGLINNDCTIDMKLDTSNRVNGEKTVIPSESGKPAKTGFRVSERFSQRPQLTLMNCELFTGRTHQIRVHAAASDMPLAGDKKYGELKLNNQLRAKGLKRMFLHASSIQFYDDEELLVISAELPDDLQSFLETL